MGALVTTILFLPPELPSPLSKKDYFWLNTRLGNRIPAFHIKNTSAIYTILYSHGNAEDLGKIFPYLKHLSELLNVSIIAYDYTGYGFGSYINNANGEKPSPSEHQCYADIDAAYHYLTELEHIPSDRIILYGRSLGSGPSCYLAQRLSLQAKHIAGLILHSPFLSIFRVVIDTGFTWSSDMFSNIDRIGDVCCPTFIIHGTEDEVVPFSHGKELFELVPEQYKTKPFWAREMGHNNIEAEMGANFITNLMKYLEQVSIRQQHKDGTYPKTKLSTSSLDSDLIEEFEVMLSSRLKSEQSNPRESNTASYRNPKKQRPRKEKKNKYLPRQLSKLYSCDKHDMLVLTNDSALVLF